MTLYDMTHILSMVDLVAIGVISNLSVRLRFDNWACPRSLMSFMQIKDYICMVIDDEKVSEGSSYKLYKS